VTGRQAWREVTLTADADGVLHAAWPVRRYRFLLSDGRTVDVATPRDDSDLRAAVLAATKADKIEGVALLEPEDTPSLPGIPAPPR
jgi:hypothetical protein